MTIDIRDNIPHDVAISCLLEVIKRGRISRNETTYCYHTVFCTSVGNVCVSTKKYIKSDCFVIYKEK